MSGRSTDKSKLLQWVVNEHGQPTAVLIAIEEYRAMQERLGEAATLEEEAAPNALRLLSRAEADLTARRLVPHPSVVKGGRSARGRNR